MEVAEETLRNALLCYEHRNVERIVQTSERTHLLSMSIARSRIWSESTYPLARYSAATDVDVIC